MNTKIRWIVGVIIVVFIIAGVVLLYLTYSSGKSTSKPENTSFYDSYDIPSDKIAYPEGWPEDLHYPQQMELVYARGSAEAGWEAALTYKGTAKEASDILESFFVSKGWTVTDRTLVDEDNFGFFVGRNEKQGVIIIGSDPSTKIVKVVLTVDE